MPSAKTTDTAVQAAMPDTGSSFLTEGSAAAKGRTTIDDKAESDAPLVSVLLSVFNEKDEALLFAAVRSIIEQTCTDWEMILYDDGSDAAGREAIRRAASLDPRIHHIIGAENRGLAYGLNESLKVARGRYIARLDDDDISAPDRLARQVAFLEAHPEYQWVGCNLELFDAEGSWGRRIFPAVPQKRDFLKYSPYAHPSVIFCRETLDATGGYRKRRKAEDYEIFMRLHAEGYQGYNLQECLYYYREDRRFSRPHTYASRVEEVRVRYKGFQRLGILNPGTLPYVIKPLLVGLLPRSAARYKHRLRKEMHVEGND